MKPDSNLFSGRRRSPARRIATLGMMPLALAGGFAGAKALRAPGTLPLPPALDGERDTLRIPFGELAFYTGGPDDGAPLLLIHSVNAAANAYEVKPLFDHYARHRRVYALDLPGFGFSDRVDCIYTPKLMGEAIAAMTEEIRRRHGAFPVDAVALSLSCEFLARVASDHPTLFRSLGLVSPTGFETKLERQGAAGTTFGKPSVRDIVSFPLWGRALFNGLVSRPSMRYFLQKTWGAKSIDEGLFEYDYRSAHQPGAEHAPFSFLAGFLFSRDALTVYKGLTVPIWMCHGVRGDFVDFGNKGEIAGRANWTLDVFRTGALPHFERLDEVTASYDAFVDKLV